ncbi:MAG: translocation/assembly module TamB domain-containing protein, partial [Planctomycetota bacterium]
EAKTGLGQVSINDAVVPLGEKAAEAMKLNLSASDVDLAKLAPFMVLFASFDKETRLSGTAESQLAVSSKDGTYTIKTDSSRIKNLRLVPKDAEPLVRDEVLFVFDGDYTPVEGNWAVRKMQLISEPNILIDFAGESNVKGEMTKVSGQARLDYDWSAVSTLASPFLPPGLILAGEVNETVDFSSTYPVGEPNQLLANLNTKAKLTFDKGQYMGLNLGATEVPISVEQGVLTIAPFTTTVNNGKLSFAGSADFKQEPTLLTTPEPMQIVENIQVNDQTTRELLMYLNPLFANAVNVSGIANFGCDKLSIPLAKGKQKLIEVEGTISLTDLRLQASDLLGQIVSLTGAAPGQSFAIRPTQFVVRDGFVKYDDMQVDIGNNPVNFKGQIGLDSSLNMTVTLPYTLKGLTARADKGSVGKRVELPLKGTLSRPKLDTDRLLKDQLIETGLDLLFDKLKKK